jgi:hypothetical protein
MRIARYSVQDIDVTELINEAAVVGDVTSGDNGAYRAGSGWDPCTGLGTPRGQDLMAALIY